MGLGGLFVGAFGLWMTYLARRSSYRDAIYARQLQASQEVAEAVTVLYCETQLRLTSWRAAPETSRDTAPQLRKELREHIGSLMTKQQQAMLFLPNEFCGRLSHFWQAINALCSSTPEALDDLDSALTRSYLGVVSAVRHLLGTEELTAEALRIIGAKTS
jgi:hypothetical protein